MTHKPVGAGQRSREMSGVRSAWHWFLVTLNGALMSTGGSRVGAKGAASSGQGETRGIRVAVNETRALRKVYLGN